MRTTSLGLWAIAVVAFGCASDAECPDGYVLDGACVMQSPDAGNNGDGDGDGDASVTDSGGQCALEPDFERGFEAPCMDAVNHSECTCEADYCAVMPGAEEGLCTVTGCVEEPDKCPDGWTCFDLSTFGIDLSFCNPP